MLQTGYTCRLYSNDFRAPALALRARAGVWGWPGYSNAFWAFCPKSEAENDAKQVPSLSNMILQSRVNARSASLVYVGGCAADVHFLGVKGHTSELGPLQRGRQTLRTCPYFAQIATVTEARQTLRTCRWFTKNRQVEAK